MAGRFSAEFPGDLISGVPRFPAPQNSVEAAELLNELGVRGIQRVKIWMEDNELWVGKDDPMPTFTQEVLGALVRGARARGMKVYIHAWSHEFYRRALELDADWIIHPVVDRELTDSDLAQMRGQNLGWTSTLSLVLAFGDPGEFARRIVGDPRLLARLSPEEETRFKADAEASEFPILEVFPRLAQQVDEYLDTIGHNTHLVNQAGLTLTLGSDSTAGYGTHVEIELLRDTKLEPLTILRAATLGGAIALGVNNRLGTVEPGKIADLVLLNENPLDEITNLRAVEFVVKGGKVWSAEDLLKD